MLVAKVFVTGVSARAQIMSDIPKGIKGATIEVDFEGAEWANLSKTVVFCGGVTKDVINAGTVVKVPPEVVEYAGYHLLVGVYGTNTEDNIAIPTLWCDLGTILDAADPSGDTSTNPALPVWAQLNSKIPFAEVEQTEDGAAVTIRNIYGTNTVYVRDGKDGERGDRGYSGVHVGSGDMPDGYNVQIDPQADAAPCFEDVTLNNTKNLCNLGTVSFVRGSGRLKIGTTLLAGKTYTLSAEVTSTDTDSVNCAVYLVSTNSVQQDPKLVLKRDSRNAVTFVPPVDCNQIVFYASGQASNSDGDTATFAYIQIEEGSVATYYVPAESAEVLTAIDYVARRKTENFEVTLGESMKVLEETVYSVKPLPAKMDSLMMHKPIPAVFASADFENGSISEAGANSSNSSRIRTKGFVDVSACSTLEYAIADGYRFYLVFFSGDTKISNHGWFTGTGSITIPEGADRYRAQIASLGDATALTVNDYSVVGISYGYAAMTSSNDIVTKTKWLAIGDSITFGVYSYMNGDSSATGVTDGWVRRLAGALGHDITVMASRGMGYTAAVTGQDPLGGSTRISLDTLLTRIEALEEDFNLITMAFGINDYATISQANLETIEAGLDNAIERLMAKFPAARLVIITPFNSSRQGSASTNYAYGYTYSGRSLKDIADLIKEKCESYGIECIYASNGFLINNFNIKTLLPDNTHPSDYGHTLIAKNMAHYLLN